MPLDLSKIIPNSTRQETAYDLVLKMRNLESYHWYSVIEDLAIPQLLLKNLTKKSNNYYIIYILHYQASHMKNNFEITNLIVAFTISIFSTTFGYADIQNANNGNKLSNEETKTKTSNEITRSQIILSLRKANEVAKETKEFGHHPFGAVLLAPDNETVLMKQGNINVERHAEVELARRAADAYPVDYLAKCTLVTTVEPCAMCSGAIYFANIGRVVFGVTEITLRSLIGKSKMHPTLNMPCSKVIQTGQKSIEVIGPVPEMEEEIIALHKTFWK